MAGSLLGHHRKKQTSKLSFPMEQTDRRNEIEHVIDITSNGPTSSSFSHDRSLIVSQQQQQNGDVPSTSSRVSDLRPTLSTASARSNSRSASLVRRGSGRTRRRSPLNSGIWISVELVLTVSQIVAAIVVLSLSRNEHPHAPLSAWIVGYASGCVAVLPLLYWRYRHRNQGSDRGPSQSHQGPNGSVTGGQYSTNRVSEAVVDHATDVTPTAGTTFGISTARLKRLMDYFKMALDCFFAIWFVVGNVWIFGGHTSASDAPKLYRLCIVFLTFSCIGYAMPFILCATICCCLPCIISVLGFREDPTQSRGATSESINSLPTYKFKVKKNKTISDKESNNASGDGSGIIAAGTERERVISGDDAVCCICLAKYVNNDELKELVCSHFFHKECVDKWLKINATCPLCKAEVGETLLGSLTEATASLRQSTML